MQAEKRFKEEEGKKSQSAVGSPAGRNIHDRGERKLGLFNEK